MADSRRNLVILTRYPESGSVKSRLSEGIGPDRAAGIYRCFVEDIVSNLKGGCWDLSIAYTPDDKGRDMIRWLGDSMIFVRQGEGDLGDRLLGIFHHSFGLGYEKVIALASDVPDIENGIMESAFDVLDEKDGIIGPSGDGGYYLIGFQRDILREEYLRGIPMGTDKVYDRTLEMFRERGLDFAELEVHQDVDDIGDLKDLLIGTSDRLIPRTMGYAEENGIIEMIGKQGTDL